MEGCTAPAMSSVTTFDTRERYILLPVLVVSRNGQKDEFDALLDTGAPRTEFSDETLWHLGFLERADENVELPHGMQTKKYGRVVLPHVEICSRPIEGLEVYVSHFEKSWGIKALIGLDFFRRFRVTIDYKAGHILTERY